VKRWLARLRLAPVLRWLADVDDARERTPSGDEMILDVVAEEQVTPPSAAGTPRPGPTAAAKDPQIFLSDVEVHARQTRDQTEARIERAQARESRLFAALVVVGLITLLAALVAVVLVLTGNSTVAVASGALALLPGTGTVLIRRLWRGERGALDLLSQRHNEHANIHDAAQFTLALPDGRERREQMAELATGLRERALATAERPRV
jgi:hypothetical protein